MIVATRRYTLELVWEAPNLTALDEAKRMIDGKIRLIETAVAHSLNMPAGVRVLQVQLRREGV